MGVKGRVCSRGRTELYMVNETTLNVPKVETKRCHLWYLAIHQSMKRW